MRRAPVVLALVAAVGLMGAPAAGAHEGGKPEPRIAAGVSGSPGLFRILTVRLTDVDSGKPVAGATVIASAEMTSPQVMRTSPWQLAELSPGLYRARVRFPMPADWSVSVGASGDDVVAASSMLPVRIASDAATSSPSGPDAAWLHWSLVLVIVGTGVYNMVYVTPFSRLPAPALLVGLPPPGKRGPGRPGTRVASARIDAAEHRVEPEVVDALDRAGDDERRAERRALQERTGDERRDGTDDIPGRVRIARRRRPLARADDRDDVRLSYRNVHLAQGETGKKERDGGP